MNKRNLQIIMAVLGLIPIATGLIGFTGINDPIYEGLIDSHFVLLDSNLRFFSGIWIGLGLAMFSIIRSIEKEKRIFRIIWISIFIGGLGRLLSMVFTGVPPIPFVGFTVLEIVGAPFFIYWQHKIAKEEN
ncbi:MAG: DUF4345 domain-containing protein [Flavobacteriales bacterium]|nr:DUF4345 domain-containing protein [Flavobacteriales bacterium]MCB9447097.1 DUF4345 domain-containing protein [Flavobacteriales bacterium]